MRRKIVMRWAVLFLPFLMIHFGAVDGFAEGSYTLDRAVEEAVSQAQSSLAKASLPGVEQIAIAPLWDDDDLYVTDLLKTKGSSIGYKIFVRDDREWKQLLDEIKWGTLREDIMSEETIQKFGRIEGVDAILYGTVRERKTVIGPLYGRVRLNLHLSVVETGEQVWGDSVEGSAWISWTDLVDYLGKKILYGIAAVIVFLFLMMMIRRATRPR